MLPFNSPLLPSAVLQSSIIFAMESGRLFVRSQGDCKAQMGAAEQSASDYRDSIHYLESCPNKAPEVQCTTINNSKGTCMQILFQLYCSRLPHYLWHVLRISLLPRIVCDGCDHRQLRSLSLLPHHESCDKLLLSNATHT